MKLFSYTIQGKFFAFKLIPQTLIIITNNACIHVRKIANTRSLGIEYLKVSIVATSKGLRFKLLDIVRYTETQHEQTDVR